MARVGVAPTPETSAVLRPATRVHPVVSAARRALPFLDAILFSYSQILFTRSRAVGALLLAATFLAPRLGAAGLLAVLLSMAVVRLARFSPDLAHAGMYGYNPLLCGLAVGAFVEPLSTAAMVLPLVVVLVVYLQTALESAIGYVFGLPVLSLPFVLVTFVLLSILPFLRDAQPVGMAATLAAPSPDWLPVAVDRYLRSLGAIFFSPTALSGLLVAAALLLYSRIGFLLSLLGYAIAWLLLDAVFAFESPVTPLVVSYNAVLVAIALGGVWFVPQRSSFVFAAVAVLLTATLSVATVLFLMPFQLPALILPFNLAMILTLYAMRQRVRDSGPKSVDFLAGSPEVNLNYFRTRVARFGRLGLPRLALPFSGRWTVTQGVDGRHTHQGLWRHGLDFEVLDEAGRSHAGEGRTLTDYLCWRLPVLAPADGTVVKVVRDVADNPPGERNPRNPWGNLVMIQHGVALYSMVCHLSAGSIEVVEGQFVRRGTRVGLCGNSGRSFVPHLHFQIQGTPRLDSPTREVEFYDVVADGPDCGVLYRFRLPREGETVRNIDAQDDVASMFGLRIGRRLRYQVSDASDPRVRVEDVSVRIDLYNNLYLESARGDRLFFENQDRQFLVYDYQGRRDGVLYLLYAAVTRVPFERPGAVTWDDVLASRRFRPRWLGWAADLIDPFHDTEGLKMDYEARLDPPGIVIEGRGRLGSDPVRTRCLMVPARGPQEATLDIGGRVRTARLAEVHDEA